MDNVKDTGGDEMDQTQNSDVLTRPQKDPHLTDTDSELNEDKGRSKATFEFTVSNLSKLEDSVLYSPPTYVRNLPWKMVVALRTVKTSGKQYRYLSFFLQCNGESKSSSWSCYAVAELRLLSVIPEMENYTREIQHLFYSKDNDVGFSDFIDWNEVTDPENGYIELLFNTITLEVEVTADAPSWDEKELTADLTIQVLLEDQFDGHQGNDLYDPENAHFRVFKIKKLATIAELMEKLAAAFMYPPEQIRAWPFWQRSNRLRPHVLDFKAHLKRRVIDFAENINPWNIFLEVLPPDSGKTSLPTFDKDSDVLLFFKMYDPKQKKIHYCGHTYVPITEELSNILPMLNQRAGFAPGTKLLLYREIRPNMIEKINNYEEPIEEILEELMDCEIIIFEKVEGNVNSDLPTCIDYFKDLSDRVEVTLVDKTVPDDQGFTMKLSQRMTYDQFARAVAQRVGIKPYLLQFFKCQENEDTPGHPLRCTFEGTLKDLLVSSKPKVPKKIFYQQLSIRVNELENKKQFKCIYVPANMKEEKELILYLIENGTVDDLLEEATKQIEFGEDSSGKLRFTEVNYNKLSMGPQGETPLDSLATTKAYRIEEVTKDEISLANDEMLVSCAHFHREVFSRFGMPFFIKIKEGERFATVKERIQKKLALPEKNWKKFKFAIIVTKSWSQIIDDEYVVNLNDFRKDENLFVYV